jgi:lipopolysaccharide biosynthesis glycosyltransferase
MNVIYVGYDAREHEGWEVCRDSILRRSSMPVHIVPLEQNALRDAGMYRRRWYRNDRGQRIDSGDGRPFSTDFTFSRFLVPALSLYRGWALFCDCDFMFTADIAGLFAMADDRYAAMCVKHEHVPTEALKMDGEQQTRYRRKNWSSLVLWNCEHPSNRHLTLDCVNQMKGQWLHAFDWLSDDQIGALPRSWNWLAGCDEIPQGTVPCGIHFTLGIPTMAGHENAPYAELWRAERESHRAPYHPLPTELLRGIESHA